MMPTRANDQRTPVLDQWFATLATDPDAAAAYLVRAADRIGTRSTPRVLAVAATHDPVATLLASGGFDVLTADPFRLADVRGPGLPVRAGFDIVYAIHDVLSRLTTQQDQLRLFRRLAGLLRPGGALVIQGRLPETADQTVRVCGVPLRRIWPAELDLMGELAGVALDVRTAGWDDEATEAQVSLYRS